MARMFICNVVFSRLTHTRSMFLCGHDSVCQPNSPAALQRALTHLHEHAAVGLLEQLNTSLALFRHRLPSFFEVRNPYVLHLCA